ncbi:MAG: TolC family protein [Prevotellaceae bacterium]|nr:TolC family protein [Prevotellaceae bacterium]
MRKIFLSMLFVSLAVLAAGQQAPYQFTLEQCLDYAFRYNYDYQSMKLSEEAKQDLYQQSKQERLPNLNASLSESLSSSKQNSSSWNGSYGLNASMPLYQGGSITNTIEQNKLEKEQAFYQTLQYENDLTLQILQAFLSVLGNEELLKYQSVMLKASEEQMNQGKIRFQAGQILESDYLLLNAQYASDKNNIIDTQIARDNSLLSLKSLLSMDPLQELDIIYPDTSAIAEMALLPTQDYALERAMQTMPSLKISNYNIDIAKTSLKISKSGYYPTLSLSGSIGTGHRENFDNYGTQLSDGLNEQVGLSLSMPIYDKGRNRSKVMQSKIALQQAENDRKQTELTARQTVVQEYQNVVSSYNKYEVSNGRQDAYFKSFEAYRVQFEAGAITAVDLLQQQNNYISALNDFIQSKYGFILQRKMLDIYMGEKIKM